MKLDTKQQVLLAFYLEYQKDLPDMKNITNTALNMDIDVFHVAVEKLDNEGYITGFKTYPADNNRFYNVRMDDIKLTRDGIEYVEQNFGIKKRDYRRRQDKIYCEAMWNLWAESTETVWRGSPKGINRITISTRKMQVLFSCRF